MVFCYAGRVGRFQFGVEMKAVYFSHDTNSFYDPKIRVMVAKFGIWTYAMFWVILEMMATQKEYKVRKEGLEEGLFPIMQGKAIIYKSEGDSGGWVDAEDREILEEDIGRLSICLDSGLILLTYLLPYA